jgi:DNA excision repair protein ERCC-4
MARGPIPADLKPEQVTAVIDTREQYPLDLSPLKMATGTLTTGDYSVVGLENIIAIERKSLDDLLCCVGRERERFDREVQRLLAYPVRALVIESGWQALERGEWRSEVSPGQAIGSVLSWIGQGLPVIMCYTHERAGTYVGRLCYLAARKRWREARGLITTVLEPKPEEATKEAEPAF